jgi:hypothetical protein
VKCLIFICSLFSFQLFIMFNFAIVKFYLHVLFAAVYFMVVINFNRHLPFFNVRQRILKTLENPWDSHFIYFAKRLPNLKPTSVSHIKSTKVSYSFSEFLILNFLKSILSQIKNLFHSISKIVLNHPALTQVSVGFAYTNDSVECLVCAYIKSISFDFPEL